MKKIFCDFRKTGKDGYCDIIANDLQSIGHEIIIAIKDYQSRLKENNRPLFSYSKIEKCNLFNLPVNFDIETTNISETKSALPYIWQIAIYETCFYGRFIDDFPQFIVLLDTILTSIKIPKTKSKNGLIIYVHNLSFEFQFIRKLFQIVPDSFLNYDKRDIIKFEIKGFSRIFFRCSYQLTRKPLRKLENSRNIIKLAPIDYSLARSPETTLTHKELDYALYDVYVMSLYFDDQMIKDGNNLSDIPYTLTGYARNYFKEKCGFRLGSKDVVPDNVKEYRKILTYCNLASFSDLQVARYCFMGGFTHGSIGAYNEVHENVYHYDLTSSYPTVLLSETYPVTSFKSQLSEIDAIYKTYDGDMVKTMTTMPAHLLHNRFKFGYIVMVRLNNVQLKPGKWECIISSSKVHNRSDKNNPAVFKKVVNGRVHSGDNLELFLTDVDYDLIKLFYTFEVTILGIQFAKFDYLPEVFCQTIADLYKDKTTLKDVKGYEYEYQLKKIILNSIYGLNVTDPIPDDYEYNNSDKELQYIQPTKEEIQEKLNEYNAIRDKPNKINYYYWGVYCTAYARYNLITMIDKLGMSYLYSDTDSVFFTGAENIKYIDEYNADIVRKLTKNPHVTDEQISPKDINGKAHILGQWTRERDCEKFVTIGAKRYLEVYKSDYKFTCAGIKPEKIKAFFENMWREFARKNYQRIPSLSQYKSDKFTFISEKFNDVYNEANYLITDTGKQSSYFNDHETTGILRDYLGHDFNYKIQSSLYLENATFKLTMFDLNDTIVQMVDMYKVFKKSGVVDNDILYT